MNDLRKMSDGQLYGLCLEYGRNAIRWRWRFAGLLPEVMRRRLYEKKGFRSIKEFAAKLAGMSEEQVNLVLNLERRFEDKPALHSLLTNGEASINKLAKIVSIATIENQEILADKVQLLPTRALETLARDEKRAMAENGKNHVVDALQPNLEFENQNGLDAGAISEVQIGFLEPQIKPKSLHVQTEMQQFPEIVKLNLDGDILKELLELQEKEIDINSLIRKMLESRKAEIAEAKEQIAEEVLQKSDQRKQEGKKPSRYIPMKVRNILAAEHGKKCSIPGCNKPAKETHHTQRFALASTNDPRYMAPLCEEHHVIAQTIDIKYCQVRIAGTYHAN
jgi:hypothetical protein